MPEGLIKNKLVPTPSAKNRGHSAFLELVSVTNAKKNKCSKVTMTVALYTLAQQDIPVQ